MGTITLTLPNWEKFNPRSDRANFTWFRLQNDFFHDSAVFSLSDSERVLYLFILCEASKKNRQVIELLPDYVAAILRRPASEITNQIQRLHALGLVTAESRHDDGGKPGVIPATYVRTDETDKTNVTDAPAAALRRADVQECVSEWKQTLEHFKIDRKVGQGDELEIARAITRSGADWVKLALQGARKQKAGKSWDPAQFVSLKIYLDPKRIERLVNLGAAATEDGFDWSKVFGGAA